jgi:amino acid transporter
MKVRMSSPHCEVSDHALIFTRHGVKAQGLSVQDLPYTSVFNRGCAAAWYAIVMITIILLFSGWTVFLKSETNFAADFITNYLPIGLFPILFFGYKVRRKVIANPYASPLTVCLCT